VRKAYFVTTVLLLISVVIQFYFAAMGVFGPQGEGEDLYGFHSVNGQMVLPALSLLAVLFAALSKAGVRTVLLTALPILLVAVQILLFILAGAIGGGDEETPTVASAIILGLHAVNGLAILGTCIELVRRSRARAFGKDVDAASTPTAAAA
jgi:carbon starvation protein CstA